MVVRTRSSGGKFISLKKEQQDADFIDSIDTIKLSKRWVYKIFLLLTFFIIVSPWLFLVLKNNSLTVVTKRITEFYDDNFSCSAYREVLNKSEGVEFSDIKKKLF
jgi:hypothetical protein